MKGKFLIHIGLPKTATTSLQRDFFPGIVGESTKYIGVFQPREVQAQTLLYQDIYNAVIYRGNIALVRKKLIEKLDSGMSIIISEEMFMVSSSAASWRDKLDNLQYLVADINYEIILTVREPSAAIFSFYTELYQRFASRWNGFIDCALYDEDMEIFHYRKLLKKLFDTFEAEKIHVFKFEDIIANDIKGLESVMPCVPKVEANFNLSHQNKKSQKKGYVVSPKYEISFVDNIYQYCDWLRNNNSNSIILVKKIARPVVKLIDKITRMKLKVQRPSESEIDLLKKSLASETAALEEQFGIKYTI
jgi:aromatic ring-cleaving dioxygenase